MFKTKKILIALAVIGANVLHNVPMHKVQAETTSTSIVAGQKINFGSYWQTYKGSGVQSDKANYNKDAITWKVLANNGGTLTLLSEKGLYADGFQDDWSSSAIKSTLNNTTADSGFAGDAFTTAELDLIVTNSAAGSKIYLLTEDDVKDGGTYSSVFSGNDSRKAASSEFAAGVKVYENSQCSESGFWSWWLRSPGEMYDSFDNVSSAGVVEWTFAPADAYLVRPALDLNLPSLIFTTNADGGKSIVTAGGSVKFGEISSTSNLDLWLDDTVSVNRVTSNVAVGDTMKLDGSEVTLAYTGAKGAGNGEYVSALFFNESGYTYNAIASQLSTGDLVGYGKGNAEVASANGTTTVDMSALDAGSYKAELFNENGMLIGERAEVKGTLTLDSSKNLSYTVDAKNLLYDVTVESANKVILTGTGEDNILAKNITGDGALDIGNGTDAASVKMSADKLAVNGTIAVNTNGELVLTGSTLSKIITGAGNLKFTGNVTTNADNIATEGTNTIESGTTTFTGGTLAKNITGAGTAEFNNTVSVADGVNLATNTNNVNGTLDVAGNITASNINFKSGSTLKVDGSKITSTPAISGLTSASVESGSKLYIANAEKETEYKILAGSGLNVQSWQTDDDMADEFKASYGLKVDTENITNNGTEFNIKFTEDTKATGSSDIGNILANLPADSEAKAWVDEISACQGDAETLGNTVNTMVNSAQLANVQTGTCVINNLATENIWDNRDIIARPLLVRGQRLEVRNVAANIKDNAKIETVEQGQANGIMPEQQKKQVYSKEIWASYIHSKQKVDGMETGHLQQKGNIQYNGVTVGTDLWSGKHGFGGVALTYADGNVNSTQKVSNVKNDVDYYGLTVYNRQDVGKFSFQYDGGITHSKNDVTMSTQGAEDVTANPKVNIYNIGGRVENSYKLSEKAEVVPFAGLRYTFVKTKEYHNSLGMGFDVDDQHMWNVPVGVAFRNNFGDVGGWQMSSNLEAGYAWNLGDRDSEQRITYGNTYDVVGFNTADKGQYFVKGALQAKRKNLTAEIGYRYSKGDTVRDSRWNFNVGVSF